MLLRFILVFWTSLALAEAPKGRYQEEQLQRTIQFWEQRLKSGKGLIQWDRPNSFHTLWKHADDPRVIQFLNGYLTDILTLQDGFRYDSYLLLAEKTGDPVVKAIAKAFTKSRLQGRDSDFSPQHTEEHRVIVRLVQLMGGMDLGVMPKRFEATPTGIAAQPEEYLPVAWRVWESMKSDISRETAEKVEKELVRRTSGLGFDTGSVRLGEYFVQSTRGPDALEEISWRNLRAQWPMKIENDVRYMRDRAKKTNAAQDNSNISAHNDVMEDLTVSEFPLNLKIDRRHIDKAMALARPDAWSVFHYSVRKKTLPRQYRELMDLACGLGTGSVLEKLRQSKNEIGSSERRDEVDAVMSVFGSPHIIKNPDCHRLLVFLSAVAFGREAKAVIDHSRDRDKFGFLFERVLQAVASSRRNVSSTAELIHKRDLWQKAFHQIYWTRSAKDVDKIVASLRVEPSADWTPDVRREIEERIFVRDTEQDDEMPSLEESFIADPAAVLKELTGAP